MDTGGDATQTAVRMATWPGSTADRREPSAPAERWSPLPWRKRLKNGLIAVLVRGVLAFAARLPGRAAIGLGAWLGRLAGRLAGSERRRVERQLGAALGLDERSSEVRRLSLAVFDHLGRSAGELAWAWRSADRVRELVRFAPGALETMRRRATGGRGVLFVTGHIGNWELLAWAVQVAGIPSASVGRRSYDPGLTELIDRWRRRWGALALWRESPRVGSEIEDAVERGISVGILIDQAVELPSVPIPFFGRPARTVVGPALLALARRIPVVVGWIRRRPDGLHVVEIEDSAPPAAAPQPQAAGAIASAWTAAWTATLERAIRDEPEQWVWMHRRWDPEAGGALLREQRIGGLESRGQRLIRPGCRLERRRGRRQDGQGRDSAGTAAAGATLSPAVVSTEISSSSSRARLS